MAARSGDPAETRGRTQRLFCAVELTDEWRDWIRKVIARLRGPATATYRWTEPDNLHLTVLFLGAVPDQLVPAAVRAVEGATTEPVECRLAPGALGGFGGRGRGVVWVSAVDTAGGLARLRSRLEDACDVEGISYDRKPLRPHLTIARVRRSRDSRGDSPHSSPSLPASPPALVVRHLALIRSELRSGGARYSAVHRSEIGRPITR